MRAKIQKTHYLRLAVLTFSYLCSMKIGIIVAMDKEFIQLKSILEHTETEYRNHRQGKLCRWCCRNDKQL